MLTPQWHWQELLTYTTMLTSNVWHLWHTWVTIYIFSTEELFLLNIALPLRIFTDCLVLNVLSHLDRDLKTIKRYKQTILTAGMWPYNQTSHSINKEKKTPLNQTYYKSMNVVCSLLIGVWFFEFCSSHVTSGELRVWCWRNLPTPYIIHIV